MALTFLDESLALLDNTPGALAALLRNLPAAWTEATEGPGTWSPRAVVGHLAHGERSDWMTRLTRIIEEGESRPFDPFDREAQFRPENAKPLPDLLDEFSRLRKENLNRLRALDLQPADLDRRGRHPTLGLVTARELIAAWTAHDMAHLLQISRVMAKRYQQDVGPFAEFLSVMKTGR